MKYVVFLLLVVGCASAPKLVTPSGRPEITIIGKSSKQLILAIDLWSEKKGHSIETKTDSNITTFTEQIMMVDIVDANRNLSKEMLLLPTRNIFLLQSDGNKTTIYLTETKSYKRTSAGFYTSEPVIYSKEQKSLEDLKRLQNSLQELRDFINSQN